MNINIVIANYLLSNKLFNNTTINESIASNMFDVYVKTIKSSKYLMLENKVINNLLNKSITDKLIALKYIDNNIKLFETYTREEIESEHNKLLKFIDNSINESCIPNYNVLSAITNLIKESVTAYTDVNVDNIHESYEIILEHIINEKPKTIIETDDVEINENILNIAVNKYNENLQQLDENDIEIITKLNTYNFNQKLELFEEYKAKVIEFFNNIDTEKYSLRINESTSKMKNMSNNINNIDDNIISLYEFYFDLNKEKEEI